MDNNMNNNEKQQIEQQGRYFRQFQQQSFEQNLQQPPCQPSFEQNLQQPPYQPSFEQNLQQQPYQQSFGQGLQQPLYQQPFNQGYESDLESPVSFGEWLSSFLIMCIPLAGIIMIFVWAFGGNVKKSKSNFFKATLVWGAIWSVVAVAFMIIILMSAAASV